MGHLLFEMRFSRAHYYAPSVEKFLYSASLVIGEMRRFWNRARGAERQQTTATDSKQTAKDNGSACGTYAEALGRCPESD
jgi:hypothetical protein